MHIDQYGILEGDSLKLDEILKDWIEGVKYNFPVIVELYQLRNKSKYEH